MIDDILLYFRLVIYALAAMGMFIAAIIEYQTGKSELRFGIMLCVAILLLMWMVLTAGSIGFKEVIPAVRLWLITPVLTLLTILIWCYVIRRTVHS